MRLKLSATAALAVLLLISATGAQAQTVQISGKVTLKQADGSVVPVAGAVIDIYRTDLKQTFQVTTNGRGEYLRAGVPMIGTYTIAVSTTGARPDYRVGVRPARQPVIDFELVPGDGSRLTSEQLSALAASGPRAPAPSAAPSDESAEDKAKLEELKRKNAELEASNRKITAANIVGRTFTAGNEALNAGRVDEAIAQYREGLTARPDEPALLANLSVALRRRGAERYKAAFKTSPPDEAGRGAAGKDLEAAAEAGKKAFDLMNARPVPSDPAEKAKYYQIKLATLATYAEAMRLVATKVDTNKVIETSLRGEEAFRIYSQYAAQETDPAKKSQRMTDAAQILFDAGNTDRAIEEYRKIIAKYPDSVDANFYLGIALFVSIDNQNYQESADYLQRYLSLAPDTHPWKAEAQGQLNWLKEKNITPRSRQATPSTPRRRP